MATYKNYLGATVAQSGALTAWIDPKTPIGGVYTGSAANEQISGSTGNVTLAGGKGDDVYLIADSANKIVETAGGGIDTAQTWVTYKAPDNVEVVNLLSDFTGAFANNAGTLLISNASNTSLVSGHGNDVLVDAGNGARTMFVFGANAGHDVVYNFGTVGATHDYVQLQGLGFTSFAQVSAGLSQVGADALLTAGDGSSILFRDHKVADFTSAHFLLPINLSDYTSTFADEFNSLSLWNSSTGKGTWKTTYDHAPSDGWGSNWSRTLIGNNEKEIYVDPTYSGDPSVSQKALGLNPFAIDNGVLSIAASKLSAADSVDLWGYKYSSGMLTTSNSFAQTYGYFEMRAELPADKGMFPAFWLVPKSGNWPPELDIMENVSKGFVSGGSITTDVRDSFRTHFPDGLTGFHSYGLDWKADTITWYVDGNAIGSIPTPASMHEPMFMIVNLAVGGDWAGDPSTDFQSTTMDVDYVRAYQLNVTHDFSGTAANDSLVGTDGADTLNGLAGADTMAGGLGDDLYQVDNVGDVVRENAGAGIDTVVSTITYGLGANLENLILAGTGAINGTGNALDNVLTGNAAANVLDGGAGADIMIGGLGDDTYMVDNVGDKVVEDLNGGLDTVVTSINYTLSDNVENAVLTGNGQAVTGNALDNAIWGSGGNDTLSGGAGSDLLSGYGGSNTYTGGTGADRFVVSEWASRETITDFGLGGEKDILDISAFLNTGVKPVLSQQGADVLVTLTGAASVLLKGVLVRNVLAADGGYQWGVPAVAAAVSYVGTSGDDVIKSGLTDDIMIGGAGVDIASYVNATSAVTVSLAIETAQATGGAGRDTLTGFENLTGSAFADILTGNAGANVIDGGLGADTMSGGLGDDTYVVDNVGDKIIEGVNGGYDTVRTYVNYVMADNLENAVLMGNGLSVTGNASDNGIWGSGGNDTLSGGAGADLLTGYGGSNTYTGGTGADRFVISEWAARETITDFGLGGEKDVVDLSAFLNTGIKPVLTQQGADVLITLTGATSVLLKGVLVANLASVDGGYQATGTANVIRSGMIDEVLQTVDAHTAANDAISAATPQHAVPDQIAFSLPTDGGATTLSTNDNAIEAPTGYTWDDNGELVTLLGAHASGHMI